MVAARRALAIYGLLESRIELITYVGNAVFRVTHPTGTYALRLHLPGRKPLAWVRSELLWLRALSGAAVVHVPQPVLTRDGALLTEIPLEAEGAPLICSLFGWIDGDFWAGRLSAAQAEDLGSLLARLHLHAARFVPSDDFARPRLDAAGMFGSASPYGVRDDTATFTAAQRETFAAVEARVQTVMRELGESALHFGLIHGDFLAKNYLFTARGIAVIDFDDCAWGYYLYDLAPSLLQFKDQPNGNELRTAFWVGYTAVRPHLRGNEDALETFVAARVLLSCRWLARNLHHPHIRERAPELIANRSAELLHFLQSGLISKQGDTF